MSSEEDNEQVLAGLKKRRVQRACDVCRRKKIRCDGPQVSGSKCSNCVAYDFDCTYNEAARKRGPPKGYVESLEKRLEKMEALLAKVCPDGDFSAELGGRFDKETWLRDKGTRPSLPATKDPSPAAIPFVSPAGLGESSDDALYPASDNEHDELCGSLSERLKRLKVDPISTRFIGKSSGAGIVLSAIALKKEFVGGPVLEQFERNMIARRPEFWCMAPWEKRDVESHDTTLQTTSYTFPDANLIPTLVQQYFDHANILIPLLHRPSFEKDVGDQLYLRDQGFALVFLVVCSIGARYVDDPRVRLDGEGGGSAGWKWFNQLQMVRKSLWAAPSLHDIQMLALAFIFLSSSSAPQACWSIAGIGIRYAQDVGAHRKKVYSSVPTPHEELWKRAFWVLVTCDRNLSCSLGRPPAIQDEDFDVEIPMDCDDEYWAPSDPQQAFKQPTGKPSKMAYFICIIKLNQILAFAMRTVYSISKSKVSLGFVGPNWEENIVAELDSALNRWIDSVPDHLRWDPTREDDVFFHQSAMLYSQYYLTQIIVHRPYIPSPGKQSPLSFSSLAICTNAARSCSHVLDIQQRRMGKPLPYQAMSAFTAGIVLLLNIWGGRRSGMSSDYVKEMADVYKCMDILKKCETCWHSAGRFWDVLCELASVGDLPLPLSSPGPALKRERSEEQEDELSPPSSAAFHIDTDPSPNLAQRTIAGSRRARGKGAAPATSNRVVSAGSAVGAMGGLMGTLPVRTEDLGRIPLHPTFGHPRAQTSTAEPGATQWGSAAPSTYLPPHQQVRQQMRQGDGMPSQTASGVGESLWGADPTYEQLMGALFHAPSPDDAYVHAGGAGGPNTQSLLDSDTLAMWSSAPSGFELDEWGSYLTGMSGSGGQQEFHGHGGGRLP